MPIISSLICFVKLSCTQAETEKSEKLFLYIDLPRFDFPVIFSEPVRLIVGIIRHLIIKRPIQEAAAISSSTTSALTTTVQTPTIPAISTSFISDSNLWSVVDPDIANENPVEDKHRRLVRSHRSSPYDRELKPNAKLRDELAVCQFSFKYEKTR